MKHNPLFCVCLIPALELFFFCDIIANPRATVLCRAPAREVASWILGCCDIAAGCSENAMHSGDGSNANWSGVIMRRALRSQEVCVDCEPHLT